MGRVSGKDGILTSRVPSELLFTATRPGKGAILQRRGRIGRSARAPTHRGSLKRSRCKLRNPGFFRGRGTKPDLPRPHHRGQVLEKSFECEGECYTPLSN